MTAEHNRREREEALLRFFLNLLVGVRLIVVVMIVQLLYYNFFQIFISLLLF